MVCALICRKSLSFAVGQKSLLVNFSVRNHSTHLDFNDSPKGTDIGIGDMLVFFLSDHVFDR